MEQQVQIKNVEQLEKWLDDKPKSWARLIALRAALRIVPVLNHVYIQETVEDKFFYRMGISILRACFIAEVEVVGPTSAIKQVAAAENAARAAAIDADEASLDAAGTTAADAFGVAVNIANAAAYVASAVDVAAYASRAVDAAVFAVFAAFPTDAKRGEANGSRAAADIAYAACASDAQWLEGQGDRAEAAFLLASQPLWLNVDPSFGYEWGELQKNLLGDDPNWQFWIDWYQSKLDGTLHNELRGGNRERLYSEIALFPNELWEEGAEVVNAKIAELLADLSSEGKIFYLDDGFLDHDFLNLDIEPQKSGALRFQTDKQGKIGLDNDSEDGQLDQSEGATNRHSEVLDNTTGLIKSFNPNEPGANACKPLIEKVEK